MNQRRWLFVVGAIVIALLLAFPLRRFVYELIVLPFAYIFWVLNLAYQSVDQVVWWVLVILIVLFVLAQSLLPEFKPVQRTTRYRGVDRGQVETLAVALRKANQGIYFKWLVANRLGKLAYQILLQRDYGKPRSFFAPLTGEDWNSTPEIQQYLEKGLRSSFADFPNQRRRFSSQPDKTPLDQDVKEVVEFLESKQGDNQSYSR